MGFGIGGGSLGFLAGAAAKIGAIGATGPAGAAFSLGDAADAIGLAGSALGLGQSLAGGQGNPNLTKQGFYHQIQARVADAKAAGIHPLFALGANTTPVSGVSSAGSGVSDAVTRVADTAGAISGRKYARSRQSVLDAASIEESRARAVASRASAARDHAAALESASRVARATQAIHATGIGRALHPNEEAGTDRRTVTRMFGKEITPNPFFSSAEAAESEFHELGGLIMGILNLITSPMYTYGKHRQTERRKEPPARSPFDPMGGTP